MTSSEKILAGILKDAQDSADAIIADAEKKAQEIRSGILDGADARCDKIIAEAKKQAEAAVSNGNSAATLIKRDLMLKEKSAMINKVLNAAADRINGLGDEEYFEFLIEIAKNNRMNGRGEVFLCEKDLNRKTDTFKAELENLGLTVNGSPADIDGGFILKYGDIQMNCAISALIHEKREILTDKVNRILFAK